MLTVIQLKKIICGVSQMFWEKVARVQALLLSLQLQRRELLVNQLRTDSVLEQLEESNLTWKTLSFVRGLR